MTDLAPPGPAPADLEATLEAHRVELTGYCYRMLGSGFEAEDAVQDTMLRAWKSYESFQGRAALRSWLYRIATNVCFDMTAARAKRARPVDFGPCITADSSFEPPNAENMWIEPVPDAKVLPEAGDPADLAIARDSVRLAFVAALQLLPPKQRAVLILREVLRWQASEVGELLGTSVASVNSALQRARATLDAQKPADTETAEPSDPEQKALVGRYLDAFVRYDMDALVALLHEDATSCMPPYDMWLRSPAEIQKWMLGPGAACRGSVVIPVEACASPAFAQWRPDGAGGYYPWSIQVVEIRGGRIAGLNYFLDTENLWPLFGLPQSPDPAWLRETVG
jgi:RNA polymerase sigma-70 factor (ECF subfamily)